MKTVIAFLLGAREFRLTYTKSYSNEQLRNAYDAGRELAHKLTFRRFEPY